MDIYIKTEFGTVGQAAMVMDGSKLVDTFYFQESSIAEAINNYCHKQPLINNVYMYGSNAYNQKLKEQIDKSNILNYAKKHINVELKGE